MTKHSHGGANDGSQPSGGKFEKSDYPSLMEILPAYLHQDFGDEYGSAADAMRSFLGDASGDQIFAVRNEWLKLQTTLKGGPLSAWQTALHQLGSAWFPQTESEVNAVSEILAHAES
jgi:hypothetical protein